VADAAFPYVESPWLYEGGDASDVVLASRARLARNIDGFPFVHASDDSKNDEVINAVAVALGEDQTTRSFRLMRGSSLEKTDARVLLEENLLPREALDEKGLAFALSPDRRISVLINQDDHLRIAAIRGGLSLSDAYTDALQVESALDQRLTFSASVELGYLSPDLDNLGTGLRASCMLHLPALAREASLEQIAAAARSARVSMRGFVGGGSGSLGDVYIFANRITLGLSETEVLDRLCGVVASLVSYEREARERLLTDSISTVEDSVFRALGLLQYSRSLSAGEAVDLLAGVRMGAAMGLCPGVELRRVTELLFLVQKFHIVKGVRSVPSSDYEGSIDEQRASLIRNYLGPSSGS
jgi:protein arginine kinase